jgi:hypothetical protein
MKHQFKLWELVLENVICIDDLTLYKLLDRTICG